ncbi:uracil-DNA glycosylase family protein [Paraglaciecola mesophila]|uniref:Uracil-DNA glycosylase family protein n=1 Tax=Paraglaciecola mesophila TaxID=197222 RepID=A0ABU9SUN2_9ALTE
MPLSPRPIIQGNQRSKILIVGQAPGIKAHETNKPWNDASGERLRKWLNLNVQQFYNPDNIAILPMAFCYPGKASSGDKPPRKECAPLWHKRLISSMQIKHVLLIGQYAQNYYLEDKRSLTERVKDWQTYQPRFFVLPHPSPRNNIWLKKNPWFEQQVVLAMQHAIAKII